MDDIVGGGQNLMRFGDFTQSGRQVDGSADVVVAVDQDHRTGGHPGSERQRRPGTSELVFDFHHGVEQRLRFDPYQHGAIAKPLGDPHPPSRRDGSHSEPEGGQGGHGLIVTVVIGEGSEPRKIQERERPKHPGCPGGRNLGAGKIGHGLTLANLSPRLTLKPYSDPMSVLEVLHQWPGRTAAAVVGPRGLAGQFGPVDQPFPLASVTKLLTAMAVLVAHEEGTLDVDEPVTDAGATVADLLAHSAGMHPDQPIQVAPARTRRTYSTAAYDLLGQLIADRSAMPFERYLHDAVVEPLGMTASRLDGSPGAGGHGSVADLLRLAAAWTTPGLIAASTLARATCAHLPELAGVLPGFGRQTPNPWGLGPEIRGSKQPHWTSPSNSPGTFGHFGQSGTMVWVDPDAGVTLVALSTEPFGPWAQKAWPALSTAVLRTAPRV